MAVTLLAPTETDGVVEGDVAMDGLLVYVCGSPRQQLEWARRRGLPIVTVDQRPIDGLPSVNVDDRNGARLGAQHLVDLGHRRIGVLTLPLESEEDRNAGLVPAYDRMNGWRDVLELRASSPWSSAGVYLASEPSYAAARALLDRPDRPTGVLASRTRSRSRCCARPPTSACGCPRTSPSSGTTTAGSRCWPGRR